MTAKVTPALQKDTPEGLNMSHLKKKKSLHAFLHNSSPSPCILKCDVSVHPPLLNMAAVEETRTLGVCEEHFLLLKSRRRTERGCGVVLIL